MPVRSMTLTTMAGPLGRRWSVSDACQINDFDHRLLAGIARLHVSDACQINDFDHICRTSDVLVSVSDACQINDFDHGST